MKEVQTRQSVDAVVGIPGSKSITHRALIAAGLAEGRSEIKNFLECEDTLFTLRALRELGVRISASREEIAVLGTGGRFAPSSGIKEIFLGNSGTSYRFLLSTVALANGNYLLTGAQRMHERPIGELVQALSKLGVEASCVAKPGFPPVFVKAKGIRGGKAEIRGNKSSQYVSSLLLTGPCAQGADTEIEVKEDLTSRPYVDLTLDVMGRFGGRVVREGYGYFRIPAGQGYRGCEFFVEGDVSSASYFWAAAAVTGGTVATKNIRPFSSKQGDIHFLQILERMGCSVGRGTDGVVVHGGSLRGIEADMNSMPDMVPTLAAIALFAGGKTVIRNVSHLRYKESDRLRSIALELGKIGGAIEELPDGLIIRGGKPLSGAVVNPHDDHRIAMSLAVVGLKVPGIKIKEEDCVKKSFPQFWECWDRL
jgi:3-phosphoshikimate 1-carboxyvinyltransferase